MYLIVFMFVFGFEKLGAAYGAAGEIDEKKVPIYLSVKLGRCILPSNHC